MRILITGSRDWDDWGEVVDKLNFATRGVQWGQDVTIVSGACPTGADAMCESWARIMQVGLELHPADWVKLRNAGKSHTREVHKLVRLAWVGPRPEGMDSCHRNGNPLDNTPSNLYYGTRSENVRDAMEHGTWFNVGKEASRWR